MLLGKLLALDLPLEHEGRIHQAIDYEQKTLLNPPRRNVRGEAPNCLKYSLVSKREGTIAPTFRRYKRISEPCVLREVRKCNSAGSGRAEDNNLSSEEVLSFFLVLTQQKE